MTSSQEAQSPSDPLESLLIDAAEVDRNRIADTLKDLIAIDANSGSVVFRPTSRRLDARQKILCYLLGRKVSYLLNRSESEAAKPKTVIEETGMASGTVHPALKGLRENRLVSQAEDGAYLVAGHQIHDALELIRAEGDTP